MPQFSLDGGAAVVLEEEIDAEYEPNDKEILDYAMWLGIDTDKDPDLLWIARAGLKAPLPEPWKPCKTNDEGDVFYFNFETGESVWDHPCDEHHRKLFAKEYAKKYGMPYEDSGDEGELGLSGGFGSLEGSGSGFDPLKRSLGDSSGVQGESGGLAESLSRGLESASGSMGVEEEDKKEKKGKKEKKEKKEKKSKNKDKEKESRLEAPKDLGPLGGLGGRLGPLPGLGGRIGSLSQEPIIDPLLVGAGDPIDENPLEYPEDISPNMLAQELEAEVDNPFLEDNQNTFRDALREETSQVECGKPSLHGIETELAQKSQDQCISDAKRSQIDIEVQALIEQYRQEREAKEKARLKEELEKWITTETAKYESERDTKAASLEADNKAKLAKQRKEYQEMFEQDREREFGELQEKHDKQMREEKQRLQQAAANKKRELEEEVAKSAQAEADLEAELRRQLADAEADRDRLHVSNAEAERSLQEVLQRTQAVSLEKEELEKDLAQVKLATSKEIQDLREKLQTADLSMEKLRIDSDSLRQIHEETNQELERMKADLAAKVEECEHVHDSQVSDDLSILQEQLDKRTDEVRRLTEEASNTEQLLRASQLEADQLKQRAAADADVGVELDKQTTELEELRTQLTLKTEEADHFKSASAESQHLREQLDAKTEEVSRIRAESESMAQRLESFEGAVHKLKESAVEANKAMSENKRLSDEVELLEKRNATLFEERDSLLAKAAESETIEQIRSDFEIQLQRSAQATLEAMSTSEAAEAALTEKTTELQHVMSQLSAKSEECERFQEMSARGDADVEHQLQSMNSELNAKAEELARLRLEAAAAADLAEDHQKTKELMKQSTSEASAVKVEIQELRFLHDTTKADLSARTDELQHARGQLATKSEECERLQLLISKGAADREEQLQMINTELGSKSEELAQLKLEAGKLAELANELERTKELLTESTAAASTTRLELDKSSKELHEQCVQHEATKNDLTAMRNKEQQVAGLLAAKNAECDRLLELSKAGHADTQNHMCSMNAELSSKTEEIIRLKQEAAATAQQHEKTSEMLKKSTAEASTAQAELDKRTRELEQLRVQIASQSDEHHQLSELARNKDNVHAQELESLQSQLATKTAEAHDAKVEAAKSAKSLQMQLEVQADEIASLRKKEATLQDQARQSSARMEKLTGSECDLVQAQIELEALRAARDRAQAQVTSLQGELASSQSKLESISFERNRQLQSTTAATDEARRLQAMLEEERAATRKMQDEAQQHKQQLSEEVRRLQALLEDEKSLTKRSRDEVQQQNRQLSEETRRLQALLDDEKVATRQIRDEAQQQKQQLSEEARHLQALLEDEKSVARKAREETQQQKQQLSEETRRLHSLLEDEKSASRKARDETQQQKQQVSEESRHLQALLEDEKAATRKARDEAQLQKQQASEEAYRLQALLEDEKGASRKAREDVQQQKQQVSDELHERRRELETLSRDRARLQAQLEESERERERQRVALADSGRALRTESLEAQEQLLAKSSEAEAAAARLALVTAQVTDLRSELEVYRAERDRLQSENGRMRTEAAAAKERHSGELERLRAEAKSALRAKESVEAERDARAKEAESAHQEALRLSSCELERRTLQDQSDSEIQTLRSQLDRERAELSRVKDVLSTNQVELSQVKASLDTKVSECQRLQEFSRAASSTASDELRSLQARLDEERRAVAKAQAEATSSSQELSILRIELDARTHECERLHAKVSEASSTSNDGVQSLQAQLLDERTATTQARTEASSKARELSIVKSELESRTAECDRLQSKAFEASRAAQEELQQVQGQASDSQRQLALAQTQITSSARELAVLQAELDAKCTECQRMRDTSVEDLQHLQKQLAAERDNLAKAQAQFAAQSREITTLRCELDASKFENKRMRERYDEEQQISQAKAADEQKVATAAQLQIGALEQSIASLRAELESKQGECRRLQERLSEVSTSKQEECRGLHTQLEGERKVAAQARAEASSLSCELASVRVELEARASESTRLRTELSSAAALAQEESRKMQSQLDQALNSVSQARAEASTASRELAALRGELDGKANECLRLRSELAHVPDITAEGLQSLRSKLEDERESAIQSKTDAKEAVREISTLRKDLESRSAEHERLQSELTLARAVRTEEVQRLQSQLEEEKEGRKTAAAALLKASSDNAKLTADLEVRSHECSRLRVEVEDSAMNEADKRELAVLRTQTFDQKAEIERLRQQALRAASSMSPDEERTIRAMVRDRDDTILQLRSDAAQAATAHSREVEELRTKLAEVRTEECRRQGDLSATAVSELQVQLRARAGEIEKLHSELCQCKGEVERLKCDARNADVRARSSEATAAEAARASLEEKWKTEVHRLEASLKEHDCDAASARDQAERARKELRRVEVEEQKTLKRLEAMENELEQCRQECQHLRCEVLDSERRLEDSKSVLRAERTSRAQAESTSREVQREIRSLRDQLQQQTAETELFSGEARKYRNELADRDQELSSIQQQLQVRDADIREFRLQQSTSSHEKDAMRRHSADIMDREQACAERERALGEREQLVVEAEALLCDRKRDLQNDQQRLHFSVLKSAMMDIGKSDAGLLHQAIPAPAACRSQTPPRQKDGVQGAATVEEQAAVKGEPMLDTDTAHTANAKLHVLSPREPSIGWSDDGFDIDTAKEGPGLAWATDKPSSGQRANSIEFRRRELRRERAALEELRKQWKFDAQKLRAAGGGSQAQAVLDEVRGVLDARASALNRSIEELRMLEHADALPYSGIAGRSTAYTSTLAAGRHARPTHEDGDLLRRWQRVLTPDAQVLSYPPYGNMTDRSERSPRRQYSSQDSVGQHLQWLRSFRKDLSTPRPMSARVHSSYYH